jgi:hypothetical protein
MLKNRHKEALKPATTTELIAYTRLSKINIKDIQKELDIY